MSLSVVSITLNITNNRTYPQNINVLGSTINPLDTANALTEYRWDITAFAPTSSDSLQLLYKAKGASAFKTYRYELENATNDSLIVALNLLGIGYFNFYTELGNSYISTNNDNYEFGQLSINSNSIAYPTYTLPTINITSSIPTTNEVGVTVNPTLNINGIKNDAGAFNSLTLFKNYNGGGASQIATTASPTVTSATAIPAQFGFADPNNPNFNYNLAYTDAGLIIPAPVSTSASSVIYTNTSSYLAGLRKKDSTGVIDTRSYSVRNTNAPQSASSSLVSLNLNFDGWYPYFYGVQAASVTFADVVALIQAGSGTKVVSSGAGGLNMPFNAIAEWCWFAIFTPFITKTNWFENALNQGSIGSSPTDLFSAPTILPVNSASGYWTGINFKIYVANKVTTLASAIIS